MMIAVQQRIPPPRTTTNKLEDPTSVSSSSSNPSASSCAMKAWTSYHPSSSSLKAMAALPTAIEATTSTYLMSSKKRNRDSFEAYDFQAHRHQKMRYSSLLREPPQAQEYLPPASSSSSATATPTITTVHSSSNIPQYHHRHHRHHYHHRSPPASPERVADPPTPPPPPPPFPLQQPSDYKRSLSYESIRKTRRRKSGRSSSSSKNSSSSSPPQLPSSSHLHQNRRAVRMTKKHYNKKKKLEMMEATDRHIQRILIAAGCGNSCITTTTTAPTYSQYSPASRSSNSWCPPKLYFVRRKAEQLDLSLRDQCNSIVQKEQDIKSWLGVTTSNKSKIVSLRKRLHDRWAEVKDLQSEVKPKRQRLKNLKFAALCEERTITEEEEQ